MSKFDSVPAGAIKLHPGRGDDAEWKMTPPWSDGEEVFRCEFPLQTEYNIPSSMGVPMSAVDWEGDVPDLLDLALTVSGTREGRVVAWITGSEYRVIGDEECCWDFRCEVFVAKVANIEVLEVFGVLDTARRMFALADILDMARLFDSQVEESRRLLRRSIEDRLIEDMGNLDSDTRQSMADRLRPLADRMFAIECSHMGLSDDSVRSRRLVALKLAGVSLDEASAFSSDDICDWGDE